MHRQCYSIITAISELEVVKDVPFKEKWRIFSHIGDFLHIMVRHSHDVVSYAPLYIHRFRFVQPHFLTEAEKFNITNCDPSKLVTVADKLRYYRYRSGLLQRETANHAGIERTTYSAYEEDVREYYPLDVLARIAELFDVDITDLLDAYNSFLYHGQSEQVKSLRRRTGLTQAKFAERYGVTKSQIKRWEQGKIRITKKMWEKLFRT